MASVAVTRAELDAAGLRRASSRSRDADAARRMLALALVLEGWSRKDAARNCGMDRQTLRDWVHRHNEAGTYSRIADDLIGEMVKPLYRRYGLTEEALNRVHEEYVAEALKRANG